MKTLTFLICVFFLLGCKKNNKELETYQVTEDSSYLSQGMDTASFHKYGITRNDTPRWYGKSSEEVVIENIIERIGESNVSINHIPLTELKADNISKLLKLSEEKVSSVVNLKSLSTETNDISATIAQGEFEGLSIKKSPSNMFKVNEIDLFDTDLYKYKTNFPGSYSIRNLVPDPSTIKEYALRDSVRTIDITLLFTDDGKIKIVWVNEYAQSIEYNKIDW